MKEWIIPAIVVAVWILNALLRNRENDEPVRTPRGKAKEDRPNRGAASDIDRFLQEIDRMKKKAMGESPPAPKPVRVVTPVVRPVPTAAVPVARVAGARAKARPVVAVPPPMVLAVEPVRATYKPIAMRQAPASSPIDPSRQSVAGAVALLRSPQTAMQAFILNEVLGPPKSRRR